ncbi:unnamed protein product [Spirodela intermedia]|uniref:Cyclin-like domain-containing protein n=1 Tax=Spirodela intermedia TaxID=51605 RepID=A0A7I8JTH3_SPIIN|nr:unnamed protein product [Spirodela intermedia]CAA6673061.1 unnamed protein product [Spirodela intermedia]
MFGPKACIGSDNALEMPQHRSKWYFSKEELETSSPSRKDGISMKKENYLRIQYCSFLQDLGMKLGLPQVAIATAIMFCHRFYLYQSHAKMNGRRLLLQTVATACIVLASKVEETPCSLSRVIPSSYEIIYKKDPVAVKRIQSKEIFEKQKELILKGERLVMATLGFDFEIQHPYKPLVAAIKKLGITQNDMVKVAWNFVNDWLKTTLCLQYKPHYIAAGSIYLAAKVTKVKLPSEKGLVWWHEFDVSPRQFEGVVQQMMVLFGYKGRSVAPSSTKKESLTPLEVESEEQCSPESCVLSRPGSSGSTSHDLDEATRHANPNPSGNLMAVQEIISSVSESPGGVLDQENRSSDGNDQPCKGRVGVISEIDKERIKAALKRRRQERQTTKGVSGDSTRIHGSRGSWKVD